jgi:hypothetical protein
MVKLLYSLLVILVCHNLCAQSQSFNIPVSITSEYRSDFQQNIDLTTLPQVEFVALSIRLEDINTDQKFTVSLTKDNQEHIFLPFEDAERHQNTFVGNMIYFAPEDIGVWKLHVKIDSDNPTTKSIRGFLRVFVPQESPSTTDANFAADIAADCSCPLPAHTKRQDWGSAFGLGSQIYIPPAAYTKVTHLIVHHSAGTNSSNNWKGVVASIFDFHVNTNGWQDVGYNWLIDPNGVIYEGRGGGDNVRGAHMCGYNNQTMGVCMLGNFELIEPSIAMMQSLQQLLAYKACKESIAPTGSSNIVSHTGFMKNISGHKEGCAPNYTSCPGKFLFAKMEAIRTDADQYLKDECLPTSTSLNVLDFYHSVYPNPAFDELCTDVEFVRFSIFALDGKDLTPPYRDQKSQCIDISSLPKGMYTIAMLKDQNLITSRFIKM